MTMYYNTTPNRCTPCHDVPGKGTCSCSLKATRVVNETHYSSYLLVQRTPLIQVPSVSWAMSGDANILGPGYNTGVLAHGSPPPPVPTGPESVGRNTLYYITTSDSLQRLPINNTYAFDFEKSARLALPTDFKWAERDVSCTFRAVWQEGRGGGTMLA